LFNIIKGKLRRGARRQYSHLQQRRSWLMTLLKESRGEQGGNTAICNKEDLG
jgi:hypothetical protein